MLNIVIEFSTSSVDATVFCKSLGYKKGVSTVRSKYGMGDRRDFVMDDVQCTG